MAMLVSVSLLSDVCDVCAAVSADVAVSDDDASMLACDVSVSVAAAVAVLLDACDASLVNERLGACRCAVRVDACR